MTTLDQQILDAAKKPKTLDEQIIQKFRQGAPALTRRADDTMLREQTREFLEGELEAEGVDIHTGGPALPRAELSLTPVERQEFVLDSSFGSGNWRQSDLGVVVKIDTPDGKREFLLDETGMSMKDFADLAGSGPEVAGAIGGTLAAVALFPELVTGGTMSLLGLAAASAVTGQTAGALSDTLFSIKNGGIDLSSEADQQLLLNIAKRRGTQAAVDFVLDTATMGGARLISPKGRAVQTSPQTEIRAAAARRGVTLSAGEKTGSPTMMRAEAMTEKVPGAVGPHVKLQQKTTSQIRGNIDEAVGEAPTAETVGRAFSDELTKQFDDAVRRIEVQRNDATMLADIRIEELQRRAATRSLSMNEAGELTRRALVRARANFRNKQSLIEGQAQGLIDELPVDQRAFIPTGDIKATKAKLVAEFPTKDGKPIQEFLPPELKKFFTGIDKLPDRMTTTEIRKLRTIIADAIDNGEALPGVDQGVLKQLEASLTRSLREGIDKAPTEDIKYFMHEALNHYQLNNAKFRSKAIAKAFRGEDQAGFAEGENLLSGLMKKGRIEDVKRYISVLGENAPAVKLARRSVIDDMIYGAHNVLSPDGVVDVKLLAKRFSKLADMQDIIFQGKSREVAQIIRLMAAKGGDLDLSKALNAPGNKDIGELLRRAAAEELTLRRDFERGVIKPIIRGELGITELAPEDFVRHVLKTGSLDDVRTLMKLAPPQLQDAFRKRAMVDLLTTAETAGKDATDQIIAFGRGVPDPGKNLLDVMRKNFGPDAASSIEKLKMVLGEDGFELMKDVGILSAARARKADAAKAVGGLVGGSIISNLLTLQLKTGFDIAKYRAISGLIRNPVTRLWLTNGLMYRGKGGRQALALVLPQMTRAVTEELGEDSEVAAEINDYLQGETFANFVSGLK